MNIKFISARMTLRPMDSEFKRAMAPSLALLTLASLTPRRHRVHIEDENVSCLSLDDKPDLVGITVNVGTSSRAYEIADQYRRRGVKVILGGIHVSANPSEALRHADSVCIGEAEDLWADILKDASHGRLRPKYQSMTPPDPAAIPPPRWELVDVSKYLYTNIVVTSRGCPYRCVFCYNSCDYVHRGTRNRPIENVVDEIDLLGTKQVMFVDDNFIGNIPWTREFLKRINAHNLRWHAAVSANIVDHIELLDQMQESGCKSLFIGFETINSRSLEDSKKHQNKVESYGRLIDQLHARGIMVNASLVFGFDFDQPDVFENTLDWLVRKKVETMTAHVLTPYPGTELFASHLRTDRITDREPTHYNTAYVVFAPKNMTAERLLAGYLWIYDEFYSLRNILNRMPLRRGQRVPFLLFNLVYRKYGGLASRVGKLGLMNWLGRLARRLSYGVD